MPNSRKYILAYNEHNAAVAQHIERNLSRVGYLFEMVSCASEGANQSISEVLMPAKEPVIMLVSDNFLKAEGCMENGLSMLQKLSSENRLLPLVLEGEAIDPETHQREIVPTRFDRVSDVIQYMNHWQNQYLDLRKQKREREEDEIGNTFLERLKKVRGISSEVGEFLRQLRVIPHYSYEEFAANDFELFFRFADDLSTHSAFQTTGTPEEKDQTTADPPEAPKDDKQSLIDLIESASPELLEENRAEQETAITETFESDALSPEESRLEPPVNLAEIPGMDLLSESEQEEDEDSTEDAAETKLGERPSWEDGEMPQSEADAGEEEEETDITPPKPLLERLIEFEQNRKALLEDNEEEEDEEEPLEEEEGADYQASLEELENLFDDQDMDEDEEEDEEEIDLEEDEDDVETMEAEEIYERAYELFDEDRIEEGMHLLRQGMDELPGDQRLRYHYALALLKYGDNKTDAKEQLETILEQEPGNEKAIFLLGELAELNHEFEKAKAYYEEVTALNPDFPEVFYRLGMLALNHLPNHEEKALKFFKQAIKKDKRNADAHYQYAILQLELKTDMEKGIKHFRRTLKYNPLHPFANYDIALVYHQLGELRKAREYYLKAIELNPELQTPENDEAFALPQEAPVEIPSVQGEEPAPFIVETETQESSEAPVASQGIVLITGATSGIGKATARLFAQHHYDLILTGRREERLVELGQELLNTYGVQVKTISLDVRDLPAVQYIVDQLDENWKQIDILINNAGLAKGLSPIHEGDIDHWNTMIDTNIKGLLFMTRAISPLMVARQSGHIINICSTAGKEVYPKGNVYCATKFAVDALTKSIRLDLHAHNIRVSQVSPGHVEETEFAITRFDGDAEKAKIYDDFNPLRAADVAETIFFIATRPAHVNIQDVLLMGTQQANSTTIDRSGRKFDA